MNGPIQPKRDSAISRRNANDTLNFLIPGSFCVGNVDIRVRVFDATHPNQPGFTSGQFQDTLEFTAVESLNIRGVGVHYTGKGLNIPAPPRTALTSTLSFVRKNYPVGVVFIAGYTVIDYAGDFTDQSGDGCGSGWDGLLDKLRDMQGDSNEIYYGLVPSGVPLGWGGCGGGDGQVAAGPVNAGATAAQEIAHAFGRDHAPSGGCGQNPGNVDGNYPSYDALPSGSIGEFGIDDLGVVKDPTFIFDFMSYCQPMWVSPYTYEGLRQHFRPAPASPIGLIQTHRDFTEPPSEPSQYLFLNFRVYRGGKVEVFPSFHYSSLPTVKPGRRTPYAIELRDSHNKVLNAQRVLLTDPHADLDSASLDFFKPIPFHEDTARVVITCSTGEGCEQKELLTVDVPSEPPKVRIVSPENGGQLAGKVHVAWEAQFDEKPLHYLLRYSNDSGQSWRAVAPRLRVTEYIVDLDHLPGGERCQFQVLATEGVRTGMAVSETFSVPHKLRETTIIEPPSGTVVAPGQIVTFLGESFSPDVGSANPSEMRWYADAEHLLEIGQEIQTSTLSPGVHTISLRASDGFDGESTASIQIEVKAPIPTTHTSLTQPNHTSRDHQVS